MKDTALSRLVLGVALALIAWLAGPSERRAGCAPCTTMALPVCGATPSSMVSPPAGWALGICAAPVLHVIIALAAALAVILLRPLSGEAIAWILILSVVVLVLSLAERPAVEAGRSGRGSRSRRELTTTRRELPLTPDAAPCLLTGQVPRSYVCRAAATAGDNSAFVR